LLARDRYTLLVGFRLLPPKEERQPKPLSYPNAWQK
jgi:hypothetical protein